MDGAETNKRPDNIQGLALCPTKGDLSQLCRVCANFSDSLIPIFEGEGLEHELESKIQKHLPIKVSSSDNLPVHLCYQCASTLIAWNDLVICCVEADKKLHQLFLEIEEEKSDLPTVEYHEGAAVNFGVDGCSDSYSNNRVEDVPGTSPQEETTNVPLVQPVKKRTIRTRLSHKIKTSSKEEDKTVEEGKQEITSEERLTDSSHQPQNLKDSGDNEEISNIETTVQVKKKRERKTKLCVCAVCGKTFNYSNNLRVHMFSHSDIRPFTCDLCGTSFKRKDHVRNHFKAKHEGVKFSRKPGYVRAKKSLECNICGKIYGSKVALSDHLRRHTGERPFQCFTCGKGFPAKSSLRHHEITTFHSCRVIVSSENESHRKCKICDAEFDTAMSYYRHKLKHNMLYICDVCGKSFAEKGQLNAHQKIHSDERPFKCDKCNRSFKLRGILQSHYKMHTDERPYPCPHCPWKCRKNSDLVVHIRTHTGEKPFECKICRRGFAQAGDMRKHIQTHIELKD